MRLIKRKELVRGVIDNWRAAYYNGRNGTWKHGDDKRVIYEKLVALGPSASADEVDAAIGNGSWTSCRCDECDTEVEAVIQVGQEPDYESATAKLCLDCVKNALGRFTRYK